MAESHESGPKNHYICQTYVQGSGRQASLQIGKLFQYTTAAQAEERAAREGNSGSCVGADAYMVIEDPNSGEVGPPTFLARHGTVPDNDDY